MDRQALATLLDERMNRTYSSLSERQEQEVDTSLLKTYLVEAHLHEHTSEKPEVFALTRHLFENAIGGKRIQLRVSPTDDPTLLSIDGHVDRERVTLYLDASNTRFWIIHSLASSTALDRVVSRAVSSGPELDRVWFPIQLLERAAGLGQFRGLGLDFDRRPLLSRASGRSADTPVEFLKMQLWGNKAAEVLRLLGTQDAFPNETTLAKVRVKHFLAEESDEFSLDDIKYDGKLTARGTSFQSHISLTKFLYSTYSREAARVEREYSLELEEQDLGVSFRGEPVTFVFNRPITDLDWFCEAVFSAAPPFRLWGIPVRQSAYLYTVRALDLHVGAPVAFEVLPEEMRVYLPQGSCGNSVLRLLTNLQHHYDARVVAINSRSENVFQF